MKLDKGCEQMTDSAVWSIIHKAWGIGAKSSDGLRILLQGRFSAEEIWQMSQSEFNREFPQISESMVSKLYQIKGNIDLEHIEENLCKYQIRLISYYDDDYPEVLKSIYDPPLFLYMKGNLQISNIGIGIVGSRKCTEYGKKVAELLASGLSENKVCVISGLARGIDTSAHNGAIKHDGGTIAVLGCGVDVIYPKENKGLYQKILEHTNGAVISELPLGSAPLKHHFPLRNRIISGLSRGIVIVEAAVKSGALITAELALEQGRDVFAVPGPIISATSEGTHKLIKDGAKMTTCVADILEEYMGACLFQQEIVQDNDDISLTNDERRVLESISIEPISVEELAIITKLPINNIVAILSILEIEGLITQIVGRKYIRLG